MSTVAERASAAGAQDARPASATRFSSSGEVVGSVELDASWFSLPVNVPLLHQVVTAQLAARRSGTQSTRTRAEVRGGSAKPYRQKGTGNARQGSIRAPHYAGGGIALGPKPRSYAQRTPRKMVQQALRCALSDRAASGKVLVVDRWALEVPRTKDALAFLAAASCEGTVLLVLGRDDEVAARSFANLPNVMSVPGDQLSAYDVLLADHLVFTDATLPGEAVRTDAAPAKKAAGAAKAKAPAKKAAPKAAAAPGELAEATEPAAPEASGPSDEADADAGSADADAGPAGDDAGSAGDDAGPAGDDAGSGDDAASGEESK